MTIRLEVRYYSNKHKWLCFKHATQLAMKGVDVETKVDDFGDSIGLCSVCREEFSCT